MHQQEVPFDIEKVKSDYLEACCTSLWQVKDWQRFVDARADFRTYLIVEIGEPAVEAIEAEAARIMQQ